MTPSFLNSQPIFDNLRLGTKNRIFDKIFKSVLNFVKILEFLLNIQYAQICSLHAKLNKFLEWPSIMKKYLSPKDPRLNLRRVIFVSGLNMVKSCILQT